MSIATRALTRRLVTTMLDQLVNGESDEQVAATHGVTVRQMNTAIEEYLSIANLMAAEDYRKIQERRLRLIVNELMDDLHYTDKNGNVKLNYSAVSALRPYLADLSKLVGANAPEVTHHDVNVVVDHRAAISDRVAQLTDFIGNPMEIQARKEVDELVSRPAIHVSPSQAASLAVPAPDGDIEIAEGEIVE